MNQQISRLMACIWMAGLAAAAAATDKPADLGKREYQARCASCHGSEAKGNGPFAVYLNRPTPDLTVLARQSGGKFPRDRVTGVLERRESSVHSSMPAWGREYRLQAGEHYFEVPYDPEAYVGERVGALTDYLAGLQAR